ncbi:MAG: hypothetical protein GEEBNDBF_01819 [bacterium]|nr:hypothetical protein [bacterium]
MEGSPQVDSRFWEAGLIPTRPVSEAGAVLPWENGPSSSTPAAIYWWTDAQGLWFDCQAARFIDGTAPRTTGFYRWDSIAQVQQQRVAHMPVGAEYDYARRRHTTIPTTPPQIASAISEYWEQCIESRILDYVREAGSPPTDMDQIFAAQGVALMPSTIEVSALGVLGNTGAAGDQMLVLQYDPVWSQIALIRWSATGHHVGRLLRLTLTSDGATASFHALREVGSLDPALVYRAWRVPGSL